MAASMLKASSLHSEKGTLCGVLETTVQRGNWASSTSQEKHWTLAHFKLSWSGCCLSQTPVTEMERSIKRKRKQGGKSYRKSMIKPGSELWSRYS